MSVIGKVKSKRSYTTNDNKMIIGTASPRVIMAHSQVVRIILADSQRQAIQY